MLITFTHLRSCTCTIFAALCLGLSVSANEITTKESTMSLAHTRQLIAEKKPVRVVLYGDSISEVKKGWNGGARTPEENCHPKNKGHEIWAEAAFAVVRQSLGEEL